MKEPKDLEFYLKYAYIGLILLSVIIMMLVLAFHEIPPTNKEVIILILGLFVAKVGSKVDFDWGSSAGSVRNAERLNQVLNTTIPTGGQITQVTKTEIQKEAEEPEKK